MSHGFPLSASRGVVAVVDDDPEIRQALAAWLGLCGLQGAEHPSAERLLAVLLDQDGQPELRAEGVHATALRLRGLAPGLPLALATALPEDETARYGAPPAGVRCLRKPVELDALEAALGTLFPPGAGEPKR